jgi:acetoin:2,6-dichlorophenolindophenol oxidoreductase subunit alpha
LSETGQHENPLVPNAKLREMYVAMAEARVLDEHIAAMQRRARGLKGRQKLESTHGHEACRVSTAIDLGPGDLVSDSRTGVVMDLLAGGKVSSLLKRVAELHAGKKAVRSRRVGESRRVLLWIDDAEEQLRMALGAALAFKTLGQKNIVVAYVRQGEIAKETWRKILGRASKLELPVIFVVLPANGERRNGFAGLSERVRQWGVPGIAVDAVDAVALYRVAQESMGRTRAGDGPVLIECVAYQVEGKSGKVPADPLVQMRSFLLDRKVCSEAWLKRAGDRVRRQLGTAGK